MSVIQTKRLNLRQWHDADRAAFADMTANAEVMRYFPAPLSRSESDALIDRLSEAIARVGYGFFAAERRDTREFIGFIGINYLGVGLPFAPCVDIGWRLAKEQWNMGFATEGARAALQYGFEQQALSEIVSMTPLANLASESVMKKIGMQKQDDNFRHPALPAEHELAEHVLYKLTREQWSHQQTTS